MDGSLIHPLWKDGSLIQLSGNKRIDERAPSGARFFWGLGEIFIFRHQRTSYAEAKAALEELVLVDLSRRRACAFVAASAFLPHASFAQGLTPVRVAYVPVIGAAALYVVDRTGWAREAGIDLKLVRFDSGPAAIHALSSGTLDMLSIGVAPVAVARARGLDIKVVSAAGSGGFGLVASEALATSFAANKDPAAAFADFIKTNGYKARIATHPSGGVPTAALHHWLWKVGKISKDDVEIVTMGIHGVHNAILAGSVDAATALEPSASIVLRSNPKLKMLVTARDMFPDIPGVVMAATGAFEKASPEALEKMVGLFARATDLIRKDPAEAAKHVEAVIGDGHMHKAAMEAALKSLAVEFLFDIRQIEAPTKALLAYQVEIGDFPKAPPTEGLFDTRWSDKILKR